MMGRRSVVLDRNKRERDDEDENITIPKGRNSVTKGPQQSSRQSALLGRPSAHITPQRRKVAVKGPQRIYDANGQVEAIVLDNETPPQPQRKSTTRKSFKPLPPPSSPVPKRSPHKKRERSPNRGFQGFFSDYRTEDSKEINAKRRKL